MGKPWPTASQMIAPAALERPALDAWDQCIGPGLLIAASALHFFVEEL